MGIRRVVVAAVGITQEIVGVVAGILSCFLYFNFLDFQTSLGVSAELLPLYVLVLSVFCFFSVISGFFLMNEGSE